jgi:predicted DNA-binding protein
VEVMKMASATVRISLKAQEVVRRLSAQTGRKMQDILDEAVELYRRQLFLEKANAAFAALRMQPGAWSIEEEERAAWDATLSDGLDG